MDYVIRVANLRGYEHVRRLSKVPMRVSNYKRGGNENTKTQFDRAILFSATGIPGISRDLASEEAFYQFVYSFDNLAYDEYDEDDFNPGLDPISKVTDYQTGVLPLDSLVSLFCPDANKSLTEITEYYRVVNRDISLSSPEMNMSRFHKNYRIHRMLAMR